MRHRPQTSAPSRRLRLLPADVPICFAATSCRTAKTVTGELRVNPLYRVERHGNSSVLTLTFPTPEYEEEFGACRRYFPTA